MKKFLALVLALVMTMSLVTISAGAKDFTDDADINYDEAVAVVSAIGVVGGYADGSFNPEGGLTRQAAAKIICNMILGPTTAAELDADTAPYPDVAVDSDFAGYIAYCQKEGIISGYADGTFKGANPLTGYAFMKMLLGALGFDGETEGYTGANWSINVAKKAIGIGLNAGLKTEFNGSDFVTREEAALYAFNTLKATMVEYDQQSTIVVGDATVTLAGTAQDLAWGTGTLNDGKVSKDGFVQFGEKYFAKLTRTDDISVFGQPANTWTYNKTDIGTFVDYTKLADSWTVEVEGGDVYASIGSVAADYDLTVWVDGEKATSAEAKAEAAKLAKKNDDAITGTGNGVLTEVYVDNDAEELTIVEINTYLAVTDDYNEKKETLKVDLYGYDTVETLKLEDFACIADYEDGDLILVTVADGVVQSIVDPDSVAGVEIEEFAKKDYVVADEKYSYAKTGTLVDSLGYALLNDYDKSNLNDVTFNLYFDTYGYLIGIEQVEADVDYLFMTAIDVNYSYLTTKTADAFVIFSDGTAATVEVNMQKSVFELDNGSDIKASNRPTDGSPVVNQWFTYTEKNGVYTVEVAPNQIWDTNTAEIDSKHVSQKDSGAYENDNYYYGNADTNYIVADLGKWYDYAVINGVESVTAGVKNVSLDVYATDAEIAAAAGFKANECDGVLAAGIYSVYNTTGAYIIASIVVGDDGSITDAYAYLYGAPKNEKYNKAEDCYYWQKAAVIAGVDTVVTFKTDLPADDTFTEGLYKLSYDKDGYAVDAVKATRPADFQWLADPFNPDETTIIRGDGVKNVLNLTCEGDTLWITEQGKMRGFALADECPAVIIEQNGSARKVVEYASVAKAIKALDNYGEAVNFDGYIYVFFKDGVVTSVVITDTVTSASNTNDVTKINVAVEETTLTLTNITNPKASAAAKVAAIEKALVAEGYENVVATVSKTGAITSVTATMGAGEYTFTIVNGDLA